jgi:transcriptional pleiotropic repressor
MKNEKNLLKINLGMKGTFIKVKKDKFLDELEKNK